VIGAAKVNGRQLHDLSCHSLFTYVRACLRYENSRLFGRLFYRDEGRGQVDHGQNGFQCKLHFVGFFGVVKCLAFKCVDVRLVLMECLVRGKDENQCEMRLSYCSTNRWHLDRRSCKQPSLSLEKCGRGRRLSTAKHASGYRAAKHSGLREYR
jgi:hypothetical protein